MNKLETLGLIEQTSTTQANNGTRCFYDPITDCDYLSYESGYVRRAYTHASYWSSSLQRSIYQLNKTRKTLRTYKDNEYECTERIMIPNAVDRLERIAHCAATYRKNNQK